jgi:hypothetical protein
MNKYKAVLLLCVGFSLLLLVNIVMVPAQAQRVGTKAKKDKLSASAHADAAAPVRSLISQAQLQSKPANIPNGTIVNPSLNYIVEFEPNNTPATAQGLSGNNVKVKGISQPGNDIDYYSFSGSAGNRVYVATQTQFSLGSGLTGNTTIEIYSTDGTTLLEADDDDGAFQINASTTAGTTLPANGTYFIKVLDSLRSLLTSA